MFQAQEAERDGISWSPPYCITEVGIEAVRLARIYSEGPDDKKFLDH